MCGIAGFCNISNATFFLDASQLKEMHQKMAHRGPDGCGVWSSYKHEVGFAHRRLSIIDLSEKAAQPMHDTQEHVVVSFNGEIYNFCALRTQLQTIGYRFISHSDTEVLIYAYHHWGFHGMLNKLDGMFALALFDRARNKLFCARDRIGIKPLYFSLQSEIFSFASEIKALWCLPWLHKKLNQRAAYHYLTYLAPPAPMTLFVGVYKLPPGHSIEIDEHRHVSFHKWYHMLDAVKSNSYDYKNQKQVAYDLSNLLRTAVHKRMVADVQVGVFLSGGIDSSVTTALMAECADQINTFTVAFSDGPELDELKYARRVVDFFGTRHHEILIDEKDAFDCYQTMIHHQDEPLGDAVCVPLYYVAQLLKSAGVTVVQVGEGSDELFCGYAHYVKYLRMAYVWRLSQATLPSFAKYALFRQLKQRYPRSINNLDIAHNWAHNKSLFYSGAVVFSELWKAALCNLSPGTGQDPIVAALVPGMQLFGSSYAMADYYRDELYAALPHADAMQAMSYLELKHRLPELLLMRVDKMTMAHSVEARVPFLDHTLVEYALGMPLKYKYARGQTKYMLKKICEGLIPEDIIYRTKMGFAAPTTRWYKEGNYFAPFLQELLHQKKGDWQELLNFGYIDCMIKQNKQASVDYSYQLWAIQNLLACDL